MDESTGFRREWIIAYLVLLAIGCAPIWAVEYFVQQDGSAHVYNSYMMGLILRGDPAAAYLALNTLAVPNSTGHWLLTIILQFADPFVATKLIATVTFAGMTASAGWLRWKTVGTNGVIVSLLLGATVAFNWMWLSGFYNFSIGVIVFVFTTGLYYGWRGDITLTRWIVLAICLLLGYWSHIVSFAMLGGTVTLLAILGRTSDRRATILRTLAAILPAVAMFIRFRTVAPAGDPLVPHWRSLSDNISVTGWLLQMLSADPFVFISRRTLPFVDESSAVFYLAAPVIWIVAGVACLVGVSLFASAEERVERRGRSVFGAIVLMLLIVVIFGPDDFGLTSGSIIRERILICSAFLAVPLIGFSYRRRAYSMVGAAFLLFAFLYQTAALWDYALATSPATEEFIAAKEHIPDNSAVASIVIIRNPPRFSSKPVPQMNAYNGVGRNVRIWDNYEVGHYLFPIIAASPDDREFVHQLTQVNAISLYNTTDIDEKLRRLDEVLTRYHEKVDVILVWDIEPRVSAILSKWFEDEPFFTNGRVMLFRHR